MPGKNKPNELYLTRVYDAPVKAVWDAWTDPEQVAKWWGPRGFTITHKSKDLKPGGHWSYTMHGPDGTDWPNKTIYYEVEKYKKLVYDHGGSDDRPPLFRVTVLFSESKGKTTMDFTMAFASEQAAIECAKFIKQAGGNGTWDRLAEYLEEQSTGKAIFVVNRSFSCDIETMYDMWTDPKHFSQWLAPTGMSMKFIRADIKPGGSSFYYMEGNNIKMYGRAEYLKLDRPHGLVYIQQFADENEKPSRHPFAPNFPASMKTTVEFAAEDMGTTRVTVTWEPHGQVSKAEMDTFLQMRAGMTQGWTGSFDKLEEMLPKK